jgi:hypothetical protein
MERGHAFEFEVARPGPAKGEGGSVATSVATPG